MDDRPVMVGQYLDLDVAGVLDVTLDVDPPVTERCFGFGRCRAEPLRQIGGFVDAHHAAAAAAGRRLEQHRVPDLVGDGERLVSAAHRVGACAGRHAGRTRHPSRLDLVAAATDRVGRGPDKDQTVGLARLRQFGPFRQEPVAGMHGIAGCQQRTGHDLFDAQIALRRAGGPMWTTSVASRAASESWSASLTATIGSIRSARQARTIRTAISPRLATSRRRIGRAESRRRSRRNREQRLALLDRHAVVP